MNEKDDYEIITSMEMMTEIKNRKEPEIVLKSNMPTLDRMIQGFVPGELIIISGPTKNGKTLFAQSLTYEFTKQNVFPLWFSYEVTPKYFLQAFDDLPLFYMPRKLKMNATNWIIQKCHEAYKKYGSWVIFIDHLHYLFDIARARNPSIEIGTVIRTLKTIAVNNNYLIFLICHTRKGVNEIDNLTYEAIRDSSFVSQESDCVLMIYRNVKLEDMNEARLLVEFHRRTGVLHTLIDMVKVGSYLKELSHKEATK